MPYKFQKISFSQERMKYYPDEAKVTYKSKYGRQVKEFSCLEWMAALVCHIPDRGGQTVRYYGAYSNVTRGRLKKEGGQPEFHIIEDKSPGKVNRSWARLIQKIYEVDPLLCPKWGAPHIAGLYIMPPLREKDENNRFYRRL